MAIQQDDMSSDTGRTAIDRHAVTAAGQLLMSAIWLEHRLRRFPAHLSLLGRPPSSLRSVAASSDSHRSDRGLSVPDGWVN
jgi:hypothetical protein